MKTEHPIPCVAVFVVDHQMNFLHGKRWIFREAPPPRSLFAEEVVLDALPGGKIENGETLWEAAEREVLEETGLEVSCFQEVLGVTHERYSSSTFLIKGSPRWESAPRCNESDGIQDFITMYVVAQVKSQDPGVYQDMERISTLWSPIGCFNMKWSPLEEKSITGGFCGFEQFIRSARQLLCRSQIEDLLKKASPFRGDVDHGREVDLGQY